MNQQEKNENYWEKIHNNEENLRRINKMNKNRIILTIQNDNSKIRN